MSACGGKIAIGGKTLFKVHPPEGGSDAWRLSATRRDANGKPICIIDRNELTIDAASGDIVQQANRFEIRDYKGRTILKLSARPPNGISLDHFEVTMPGGRCTIGEMKMQNPFPPPKLTRQPVIRFESTNGGQATFINSGFSSSTGLCMDIVNGALQIK